MWYNDCVAQGGHFIKVTTMSGIIGSPVKEQALQLVNSLPPDASWDDLMYRIYVRQAIESGLQDAEADRTTDVSEVRQQFGLSP
jgi:hypothetical protein